MSDVEHMDPNDIGTAPPLNECLFCSRTDGGFESREHIIPESLGNRTLVLPQGVVCDHCNNGILAELDGVLCDFKPIAYMRTHLGIMSKKGRVPATRTQRGIIQKQADGGLVIRVNQNQDMFRERTRHGDDVELELRIDGGPRLDSTYSSRLARSLLKIGMELLWLEHGNEAFNATYSDVRAAVLGRPFVGKLCLLRLTQPTDQIGVQYFTEDLQDGKKALHVAISVFGVYLSTCSAEVEVMSGAEDFAIILPFGPSS